MEVVMNNVLVAYASKYGATAEIAQKIGDVLRAAGVPVTVLSVENVRDVSSYDAVVLGSAVYTGHWLKEAVAFLETNEKILATKPVWFFSSGPTGDGDPVNIMHGWRFPEAQQPIADRIKPKSTAFFHGKIDLHNLHFAEKLMMTAVRAKGGDFRDWESISTWAKEIATQLQPRQDVVTT
jgi:menaquinone-dependent protoporphyrinogen oxidase